LAPAFLCLDVQEVRRWTSGGMAMVLKPLT